MEEFRGIVFRNGPTGRRAALSGGPDVWELMATLKSDKAGGEEVIASTAELLKLTDSQVRTAVRYYGAFPDEIDQRITRNIAEADEAEVAWQHEHPVSAGSSSSTRTSATRYTEHLRSSANPPIGS